MPGTLKGGLKAQATIVGKMGVEEAHKWRQEIGAKGGRKSKGGGFKDKKLAIRAGRLGGKAGKGYSERIKEVK